MAVDPARVKSLFLSACELRASDRSAFLYRECGGDVDLRNRVEALLAADESDAQATGDHVADGRTRTFSDAAPATGRGHSTDAAAGTVVAGKYVLAEPIGEGGMGSVWRAKQTEPVKRFVAVKLIKAGMDSRQVLTRFEVERQALALMDHPNIAKVLDGGLHEHRPFFVMELVKGVPITEYCDANKLTPHQRLELFVQACQAIQHAHQKGIIHRDIKPSNVLVTQYDNRPVVKVIDFGVAKATGGTLMEQTLETGFGGVVGTPQYMSPEQATFNNLDIDTRSDVYALGVLLYELLVGNPPFSGKELQKKGLLEILRVVREEEPPRPSTKLSSAEALPSLSANRGTEPKKLTGLLRNELDWIVMKALEKDRGRRYETANGFAADVQRYLGGEAVQAHPPSTVYRVRKFVKRNKGQVIAISVIVLSLVVGIIGTTLGLLEAKRQEQDAVQAKELAETKRQEAERNLAYANQGNDVLYAVFDQIDPESSYDNVGELREVLRKNLSKAVSELERSPIGDELTVATIQNKLAVSLLSLGDTEQAITLLMKARSTREAQLGRDHLETLKIRSNLAEAYNLAGRYDDAIKLHRDTHELTKNKYGANHAETLSTANNLSSSFLMNGQADQAIPLLEETVSLSKDSEDPIVLMMRGNLASGYQSIGQPHKALDLCKKLHTQMKAKLGHDHPKTLVCLNNLAVSFAETQQYDAARPLLEECYQLRRAKLGSRHPETLMSQANLAKCLGAMGQGEKAIGLLIELLPMQEARLGRKHPETQRTVASLGVNYKKQRQLEKALPYLEEAHRASEKTLFLRWVGRELLEVYEKTNQPEPAARLIAELVRRDRLELASHPAQLAKNLSSYGGVMARMKNYPVGEPLLREALSIREKAEPEAWTTFDTRLGLGVTLMRLKKYGDAEPVLLQSYGEMMAHQDNVPKGAESLIPEALQRLIQLYTAMDKPAEVKKYQELRSRYLKQKEVTPKPGGGHAHPDVGMAPSGLAIRLHHQLLIELSVG